MRICFIADVRSPISLNWIRYFVESGQDVHVISSYPYTGSPLPGARVHSVPLAFSGLLQMRVLTRQTPAVAETSGSSHVAGIVGSRMYPLLSRARYRLAPLEVRRHVRTVRRLVADIQPDLVHAMRIPYEGILASLAVRDVPLLLSVWGNDFTLHATRDRMVGALTRQALRRVDALHCDCFRDLRLARDFGFDPAKPSIVVPGAGGIRTNVFHAGSPEGRVEGVSDIPAGSPVIVNPRGFRQYVRNDTFFQAIPLVLRHHPEAIFLCSGMRRHAPAEKFVRELGLGSSVRLLPMVPHHDMADVFRFATIAVSPSEHDGTPNTLLEAMACGCFPVAGNIESIREWITHGVNGLLCDPGDPSALADAILHAIENQELRATAASINTALITKRADYQSVMPQAAGFYAELISQSGGGSTSKPCAASPA
jgi:glycosyltransferase involved in cell wall biosynthesis